MLEKFSRRMLLGSGLAVSGTALAHLATTGRAKPVMQSYSTPVPATEPPLSGQPAPAAAITSPRVIRPELLTAALDALRPLGVEHIDMPLTASRMWQTIQQAKQLQQAKAK